MDELGIDCDVAGLAKKDEEIWLPNKAEPVRLSRRSEALKVLQFVRDETHRFATGLNQRLRSKELSFHVLESIEGIGPKRAAAIMKNYGDLENIANAEPPDMAGTCGISEAAARAVRAAARLAIQDQKDKKERIIARSTAATGRRKARSGGMIATGSAAALADQAAQNNYGQAAEDSPDYAP
jgi:excinuclease ABC subunit C